MGIMIYDCFPFFNELDVLEIRLNILYDTVDYFVITEADKTNTFLNKTRIDLPNFWTKLFISK